MADRRGKQQQQDFTTLEKNPLIEGGLTRSATCAGPPP
jgi:hypothetical protein